MFMTFCRIGSLLAVLVLMATASLPGSAFAQDAAPAAQNAKIEELIKLLDDPEVRAALDASRKSATEPVTMADASDISRVDTALRDHFVDMVVAAKRLPDEIAAAARNVAAAPGPRDTGFLMLLLFVLIPAFAVEWFIRQRGARRASAADTIADSFGQQLLTRLAPILGFAIAGIAVFLALGSAPMLRKIVGVILVAIIIARFAYALATMVLGRALLMNEFNPEDAEQANLAPDHVRSFWARRLALLVGYFIAAWAFLSVLPVIGISADVRQLLAYIAGLGLMAIAIEIVWNVPRPASDHRNTKQWLLSIYFVILWLTWAAGLTLPFWLGLYLVVLPKLISVVGNASQSFLQAEGRDGKATPFRDILIARGARAVVILLAVFWIAFIMRVHPGVLTTSSDYVSTLMRSLLRAVLILVAADLIWQLLKAAIDYKLAAGDPAHSGTVAHASRLRTLLPIFRNALAVLVATIAGLMILAEFGVQIGPLIAGAGIFGVAIGFGSQTLVKDIVSGIFYLTDDAFRVGEYIQSGSYKGTVEGFSLRSVRLRHHRGPVFTVPFGTLGAVQNMSRDWVIDKFVVRFPFETNIKLVKKLTKTIGAELEADEELGPIIMQTVKMKGVELIGDYGIDVSFAFMTKPGYQTSVRRRAYSMMRDAFAENGIEFARPSVSVGGGGGGETHHAAGAASAVIARQKAEAEAKI